MRGNGNCMFHALKGGMKLRNMTDKAAPYFPCRYLRRMLVAYMANNRDLMWKHKEASLRGRYGLAGGDDCPDPISFKEYLIRMLKRGQWGDDIILYVSLRLRVQNVVPAQPCVGKLGISLVLLNFLHCNFRLWFKTP